MARGADRPVHALPRHLVRRRRGGDAAGPPRADHAGPCVPHGVARRLRREGVGSVTRALPFPGDPPVTPQLVRDHNLTDEEYGRIEALLGRAPTFAELGVFSALWSEHCSYKHSRPILQTFPTAGPQVVQGPGENAGVLRLPDGWAVAFKIESHNHPSAVEPYQGAATGVGGILRDVFTMGARPVALLNSLRFGPLEDARNRYLLAGVVRGVGDYGNCVGVPTLGGEVDFGRSYSGNPLVNAMCVGLLREADLITAAAHGVGNVLVVVGSSTGRDGIHGASFASEELTHASERRRPQVQVGDPFTEKLLLEASLELIASGHIVAIQDMGAAGLTSSSAEMAAKGGVGVEIDLSRVPTREPGMTPYEILLSESQERMLVVAKADRVADVQAIAAKWELTAKPIGRVTDDGMYRATWKEQVVVEIPGRLLIDDCPVYHLEAREDPAVAELRRGTPHPASRIPHPADVLLTLLDHPAIASKRWVYEQYDSTVQASTVIAPGGDAGVIRVREAEFGLAVTTDGNSRYVALDPYEGGNVSFYNESPSGAVDPTPVIGMVGLLARADRAVPSHARSPGDVVFVLGETQAELGGSVLWEALHGFVGGVPPRVDLAAERRLVDFLVAGAERALFRSAHDCSQGGLGVALAEVAMSGPYDDTGFGLDVDLTTYGLRLAALELLFSESHGRAVVTCQPARAAAVVALAQELGVLAHRAGTVGERGGALRLRLRDARVEHPVDRLRKVYFSGLARRMGD